jgi:hypothetical protein
MGEGERTCNTPFWIVELGAKEPWVFRKDRVYLYERGKQLGSLAKARVVRDCEKRFRLRIY